MSLTIEKSFIHLTYPGKTFPRLVLQLQFLIIKINEYDVGAGYLADPLYLLPSECVTVLINNLEQMRMHL